MSTTTTKTTRKYPLTPKRLMAAVEADDNLGFCLACGAEHDGLEPDARRRTCEECGQPRVFGAEEILIMSGLGC